MFPTLVGLKEKRIIRMDIDRRIETLCYNTSITGVINVSVGEHNLVHTQIVRGDVLHQIIVGMHARINDRDLILPAHHIAICFIRTSRESENLHG